MRFTTAMMTAIVLSAAPSLAQATRGGGFEVRTLSTRADLVSGGDVLIQITAPRSTGTTVAITVNGRQSNAELKPSVPAAPTGIERTRTLIAQVKDLRLGPNVITVGVKGQNPAVQIAVVNHPITGPVISGPHQTPF